MSRSIWSGALSFGLVNIPVKLYTAVREERVAFHLLHDQDKVRLKQKMVCPEDGKEVHREHMVKGFEISPDKYVIVRDSELEAVAPKSSRIIELQDFVDLKDIDPVFFDRPYYLVPQQHAEKAYKLLVDAMQKTGKVGIAKFTMRSKEYLAALRPSDGVIVLETMHFDNEVTPAKEIQDAPRELKVDPRELHMAEKLIENLSTDFKPAQYHDEYRERVMELIKKKAHGEEVVTRPQKAEKETRTADLMAALEASLATARNGKSKPSQRPNPKALKTPPLVATATAKPPTPDPAKEIRMSKSTTTVTLDDRELSLSNLDKVLYPATGFTKGQVIDYYVRMADTILPHLKGRPLTLKRYPNGVDSMFFYEKRCPSHKPSWIKTATLWSKHNNADLSYCTLDEPAALAWTANLASIELHVLLSKMPKPDQPTAIAFDFDPGPPAGRLEAVQVLLMVKDVLDHLGLESFPKTSGGKGMHLYVPLNTPVTFDDTKSFAKELAEGLERAHPDLVTSNMLKSKRHGRVFMDWSQNDSHKTTVCVYSLRAREHPTVSTPVTWDEISKAVKKKNPEALIFEAPDVQKRIEKLGDLFAPVLTLKQKLPGKTAKKPATRRNSK